MRSLVTDITRLSESSLGSNLSKLGLLAIVSKKSRLGDSRLRNSSL